MSKKDRAFFRQALVALSTGLGGLGASLTLGYTSPALPSMRNDPNFHFSEDEASWIGSGVPAFALLGSLLSGLLVDSIGRKRLSLFTIPFSIISWLIIALSPNVYCVIGGRLLGGICLGIQMVAESVYMSECVHVDLRGYMNAFPGLIWTLGFLLINSSGKFLDWRGIAWMSASLRIPSLLLIMYLPETPIYLLNSGKKSEALKVMTWLRDSISNAQKEIKEFLSVNKESDNEAVKLRDLFVPPNLWPVSAAFLLHFFQQLSGINALMFYSTSIFEAVDSPHSLFDPATSSIIMSLTNVVLNPFSSYLFAKKKRKWLIRRSSTLIVGSLASLSLYFYCRTAGGALESVAMTLSFIPLLSIIIFVIGFCMGWGPLPFIFLTEGLPSKVIGMASALAISINWILAFFVTKTYFSLVVTFGYSSIFLTFCAMSLLGMFVMQFYLPESFGRSTSEMDKYYMDVSKKKKN